MATSVPVELRERLTCAVCMEQCITLPYYKLRWYVLGEAYWTIQGRKLSVKLKRKSLTTFCKGKHIGTVLTQKLRKRTLLDIPSGQPFYTIILDSQYLQESILKSQNWSFVYETRVLIQSLNRTRRGDCQLAWVTSVSGEKGEVTSETWGENDERENSPFSSPVPPSPSKISTPLTPEKGLILRLSAYL